MSVKQDIQEIKAAIDRMEAKDSAELHTFVKEMTMRFDVYGPVIRKLVDSIPNAGFLALGLATSAATERGRAKIAEAVKEVFGVQL